MTSIQQRVGRNQTLEICKLIASIFVVFIHAPFPGKFGKLMVCLARFAVPMFFAVSGYFSYQVDAKKLMKRLKHILVLEIVGILVNIDYWSVFGTVYFGGSLRDLLYTLWQSVLAIIPGPKAIALWLLLTADPFAGQLWYLVATAECYVMLWLYTLAHRNKPVSYRPLYVLSAVLLIGHLAMGEFSEIIGITVDDWLYRNAVFFGLPMFTMGIFLREYREKLICKFALTPRKIGSGLLAAALMSVAERVIFGTQELYLGSVAAAALVILLAMQCPGAAGNSRLSGLVSRFGFMSTAVYIGHMAVHDVYMAFFVKHVHRHTGTMVLWLTPVLILLVSLLAAVVWERLYTFLRTAFKR